MLSTRADLVTGGSALVEILPATGIDPTLLKVDVAGRDVTGEFAQRSDGRFVGLVAGLADGANVITAKLPDGSASSALTVTNHPITGPLIYGPRIEPWKCDPGATDANCSRPIAYSLLYKSSNSAVNGFRPYDAASPPSDVATTTTSEGKSVPFVIRLETGVQNRDYYSIAVLFDPAQPWTPFAPQPAWNRAAVFIHGLGCGAGYGQSGALAPNGELTKSRALDEYALSRGFMVASVALLDAGRNCIIPVEAEAQMMAKEHIIETYGELKYVFGYGASGGAITQYWIANAYPGLYDGIIGRGSFADYGTAAVEAEDCALLRNYFDTVGASWTDDEQAAAAGQLSSVCKDWVDNFGYHHQFDPHTQNLLNVPGSAFQRADAADTTRAGCSAPTDMIYDATSNPTGIRCTLARLCGGHLRPPGRWLRQSALLECRRAIRPAGIECRQAHGTTVCRSQRQHRLPHDRLRIPEAAHRRRPGRHCELIPLELVQPDQQPGSRCHHRSSCAGRARHSQPVPFMVHQSTARPFGSRPRKHGDLVPIRKPGRGV